MDLKGIMLSEGSQTEKDKYYMISLIYEIQKIKLVNITKKKDSQTQRTNQWLPVGREKREGQYRGRGLRDKNYYV